MCVIGEQGCYAKQDWSELTEEQKAAAPVLEEVMDPVPVDDLKWDYLTDVQRAAAKTLGYTMYSWVEGVSRWVS